MLTHVSIVHRLIVLQIRASFLYFAKERMVPSLQASLQSFRERRQLELDCFSLVSESRNYP